MKPRILLLEDEQAIADTLLYALRTDGFEVTHVQLAQAVLAQFDTVCPDLVVLDVGVPDGNGFEVCRQLRKLSQVPVMFLTARTEEVDRIVGLELGADDYVTKPFSPREVCARIRAILRRGQLRSTNQADIQNSTHHTTQSVIQNSIQNESLTALSKPLDAAVSEAVHHAAFRVDTALQRIAHADKWLDLTRYEYSLFATLLSRPERIFSRAQLMQLVWLEAPHTSERTVDAHIKLLRAKLRAQGASSDCIQTHRHMGYSYRPHLAPNLAQAAPAR